MSPRLPRRERGNVIVESVNANKRHRYKAGEALARADVAWLSQLVVVQFAEA